MRLHKETTDTYVLSGFPLSNSIGSLAELVAPYNRPPAVVIRQTAKYLAWHNRDISISSVHTSSIVVLWTLYPIVFG